MMNYLEIFLQTSVLESRRKINRVKTLCQKKNINFKKTILP